MKIIFALILLILISILSLYREYFNIQYPDEVGSHKNAYANINMRTITNTPTSYSPQFLATDTTSTKKNTNNGDTKVIVIIVCSIGGPVIFLIIMSCYCRRRRLKRMKKVKEETTKKIEKQIAEIQKNNQNYYQMNQQGYPPYQLQGQPMYYPQQQQQQWPNMPNQMSFTQSHNQIQQPLYTPHN